MQVAAPSAVDKVPMGQGVGATEGSGQKEPAGHGAHADNEAAPVELEKKPAGHARCVALKEPAGQ